MTYKIKTTKKFDKDVKRCIKRGLPMKELQKVIHLLEQHGKLPSEYRPHKLTGDYVGCWECHIKADWLLVWQEYEDIVTILLTDTGSHTDLFG